MPLNYPTSFVRRLREALGQSRPRSRPRILRTVRRRRARHRRASRSRRPAGHHRGNLGWSRGSATSTACRSSCAARAPATPAARCRRSGGVVLSMERLNRILEIDEVNLLAVVEPNVITGDLQRAVEAVGLFYPAGSGQPRHLVDRRQRRRVRRRTARVQVRDDEALRAGARGGAAERGDHPHRLEGGEERRRLRPDAAAGRIRGHARHHHEDHAAADSQAARARHRRRVVSGRRRRRWTP